MDRLPDFLVHHWQLSAAFAFLAAMLVFTESRRGGLGLSPTLLGAVVNRDNGVLLDVRTDSDFRAGHVAGSINIPHAQLATRLGDLEKYKGRPLVVICELGNTAGDAAGQLLKAGHAPVYRLTGGLAAWRAENLPVVKA